MVFGARITQHRLSAREVVCIPFRRVCSEVRPKGSQPSPDCQEAGFRPCNNLLLDGRDSAVSRFGA